jgi:hypothetical protein
MSNHSIQKYLIPHDKPLDSFQWKVMIFFDEGDACYLKTSLLYSKMFSSILLPKNIELAPVRQSTFIHQSDLERFAYNMNDGYKYVVIYVGRGIIDKTHSQWPEVSLGPMNYLNLHQFLFAQCANNILVIYDCYNASNFTHYIRFQRVLSAESLKNFFDFQGKHIISSCACKVQDYATPEHFSLFSMALEITFASPYLSLEASLIDLDENLKMLYERQGIHFDKKQLLIASTFLQKKNML